MTRRLSSSLLFMALLLIPSSAFASHFRFGTIAWRLPNPITAPRTVEFTVTAAWRTASIGNTSLVFGDATANNAATTGTLIGSGTDSVGGAYSVYQYQVTHT